MVLNEVHVLVSISPNFWPIKISAKCGKILVVCYWVEILDTLDITWIYDECQVSRCLEDLKNLTCQTYKLYTSVCH